MRISHLGVSVHRLKDNPIEAVFSKQWKKENNPPRWRNGAHGITELLLCSKGDGSITRELTQEQATAAATAIQWLGSPVGFGWLKETLEKVGYHLREGHSSIDSAERRVIEAAENWREWKGTALEYKKANVLAVEVDALREARKA